MKKIIYSFFIIFLFLFLMGCTSKIQNLETNDQIHFSCEYKNTKRTFLLYKPDVDYSVPVVFMLHGYGSSAEDFENNTKFDISANDRKYAAVFIDGIPDPDDKTSSTGWNSGLKESRKDDLGFIESLISTLSKEYNFSKVYAVGYSNGGFMIHRLAVESNKFTAVVSVAGFLPEQIWNKRPKKIETAFMQINGTKDDVVPMKLNGSAKFNKNPAIEDVLEYYKSAYKNEELIQHIVIPDGRHSWSEQRFCGFDVNTVILDFFDSVQ